MAVVSTPSPIWTAVKYGLVACAWGMMVGGSGERGPMLDPLTDCCGDMTSVVGMRESSACIHEEKKKRKRKRREKRKRRKMRHLFGEI